MSQMIIANRLIDGLVIYMGPKGEWVGSISEGAVFENEHDAQRWLGVAQQAVEDSVVVDPYLIDIDAGGGKSLGGAGRCATGYRHVVGARAVFAGSCWPAVASVRNIFEP